MFESLGVTPTTHWLPPKILKIRVRHACGAPADTPDLTRTPKLPGTGIVAKTYGATTYAYVSVLLFAGCIPLVRWLNPFD